MVKVMMSSVPAELTPEEIEELKAAEEMPIVFDEDCPEMTSEMLKQFHRMDKVSISISPNNMKKIKSFGPEYAKVLSNLLDLALNDTELLKKCL